MDYSSEHSVRVPETDVDESKQEVINIMVSIAADERLLAEYIKTISIMKKRINNKRSKLYKKCNHSFFRDSSCASDDIFKYVCKKCKLYKGIY